MSHRGPQLPFSRHVYDTSAYRLLQLLEREGPDALSKNDRHRLFWLGYLNPQGKETEEGQAFCRAMEDALRNWRTEGGCSSCRGVYHPSTGHVLSDRTRLCGPCARDMLAWLKKHMRRKWGKLDFYEHAMRKPG